MHLHKCRFYVTIQQAKYHITIQTMARKGFSLTPDELKAKEELAKLTAGKEQMGNFRPGAEEADLKKRIPNLAERTGRAIRALFGSGNSND